MKKFHLIDIDHNYDANRQERLYMLASQMALKYGRFGSGNNRVSLDRIREFWKHDDHYPSLIEIKNIIRVPSVKWYMHNKTSVSYPIWTPDFLHGLLIHCRIMWRKNSFPTCNWHNNENIASLIRSCPYGGDIKGPSKEGRYCWNEVPALYLKYSEDSISYLAGVMSGLKIVEYDNIAYAQCNEKVSQYFLKCKIPIEHKRRLEQYMISPLWPALFVKYMPEDLREKWLKLKKPYKADIYAPILWKTYVGSNFRVNGIPYLKSRRMIFYDFKCDEGTVTRLNKLRVEMNLTELDNRIGLVVKEWAKGKQNEVSIN